MVRGKRDRRASENHGLMLGAIRLFFLLVLPVAMPALAQERTGPAGIQRLAGDGVALRSDKYDQDAV
jgi:hypothetical protein